MPSVLSKHHVSTHKGTIAAAGADRLQILSQFHVNSFVLGSQRNAKRVSYWLLSPAELRAGRVLDPATPDAERSLILVCDDSLYITDYDIEHILGHHVRCAPAPCPAPAPARRPAASAAPPQPPHSRAPPAARAQGHVEGYLDGASAGGNMRGQGIKQLMALLRGLRGVSYLFVKRTDPATGAVSYAVGLAGPALDTVLREAFLSGNPFRQRDNQPFDGDSSPALFWCAFERSPDGSFVAADSNDAHDLSAARMVTEAYPRAAARAGAGPGGRRALPALPATDFRHYFELITGPNGLVHAPLAQEGDPQELVVVVGAPATAAGPSQAAAAAQLLTDIGWVRAGQPTLLLSAYARNFVLHDDFLPASVLPQLPGQPMEVHIMVRATTDPPGAAPLPPPLSAGAARPRRAQGHDLDPSPVGHPRRGCISDLSACLDAPLPAPGGANVAHVSFQAPADMLGGGRISVIGVYRALGVAAGGPQRLRVLAAQGFRLLNKDGRDFAPARSLPRPWPRLLLPPPASGCGEWGLRRRAAARLHGQEAPRRGGQAQQLEPAVAQRGDVRHGGVGPQGRCGPAALDAGVLGAAEAGEGGHALREASVARGARRRRAAAVGLPGSRLSNGAPASARSAGFRHLHRV